ncbi:MAG: SecDF P1 head subdomain-containing protein [Pseudonocardiaceae bacterium]
MDGCSSDNRNPSPASTVRLSDSGGRCYDLRAAELTISRADASAVPDNAPRAIEVALSLGAQDAASLDQVAHRNLGDQAAVVMFGRVLSAPTFAVDAYGGHIGISGLDPITAAEVVASLTK